MRLLLRLLVASSLVLAPAMAGAIRIETIEVGDVYYLDRDMDSNVLVVVLGIDPSGKLVKVRFENGAVDWVPPGRLLSHSENQAQSDAADRQAWRLLGCLFDNSICQDGPWHAGARHPVHPNVIASAERNNWRPAPGYVWDDPQSRAMTVQWSPGMKHPEHANVIAGPDADTWLPESGYVWAQPDTFGPVTWRAGTPHRHSPNIVAGPTPGKWQPAAGYVWRNPKRPGDYSVVRK